MQPFLYSIRQHWRPAYSTWLLMGLALLLRIEHRSSYRSFFLDTEVQVAAAQQVLQGHGLTRPVADRHDWSRTQQEPLRVFMPGYAYLLTPWLWLTQDPYLAVWLLDSLGLVLLLAGFYAIMAHISNRNHSLALHWGLIFLALSPAPFHDLSAAGLLCLALLTWAWWGMLKADQAPWLGYSMALGLCLVAAWSRTAYLPLACLPLGFGLWQMLFGKKKLGLIPWYLLAGTTAGLGLILWESPVIGGYGAEVESVMHWSHLRQMAPFMVRAMVYYGQPHELAIANWNPMMYLIGLGVLHLISLGLLGLLIRSAWQHRHQPRIVAWTGMSFLASGATLAMLVLLALRTPPQSWQGGTSWTFLLESRYYAPVLWAVVIWLFWAADQGLSGAWRQTLRVWLLLMTLLAYSYPLWLKVRLHLLQDQGGTFWENPQPAYLDQAQSILDTATHPVRILQPAPSASWAMAGIIALDGNRWDSLALVPIHQPVYLIAPDRSWLDPLKASSLPLSNGWYQVEWGRKKVQTDSP